MTVTSAFTGPSCRLSGAENTVELLETTKLAWPEVLLKPDAVSCVADTYFVVSNFPARVASDPVWKLVPVIVSVKTPIGTGEGLAEVIDGTGIGA